MLNANLNNQDFVIGNDYNNINPIITNFNPVMYGQPIYQLDVSNQNMNQVLNPQSFRYDENQPVLR